MKGGDLAPGKRMATFRYLVNNVDSSINFYTTHLGFSLVEQMGPAFAIVAKEDVNLWLSGPQASAARPMPDGRKPEAQFAILPGMTHYDILTFPPLAEMVLTFLNTDM
jgi:hypothetical protein